MAAREDRVEGILAWAKQSRSLLASSAAAFSFPFFVLDVHLRGRAPGSAAADTSSANSCAGAAGGGGPGSLVSVR